MPISELWTISIGFPYYAVYGNSYRIQLISGQNASMLTGKKVSSAKIFFQISLLISVILFFLWVANNANNNLTARGDSFGFGFLSKKEHCTSHNASDAVTERSEANKGSEQSEGGAEKAAPEEWLRLEGEAAEKAAQQEQLRLERQAMEKGRMKSINCYHLYRSERSLNSVLCWKQDRFCRNC